MDRSLAFALRQVASGAASNYSANGCPGGGTATDSAARRYRWRIGVRIKVPGFRSIEEHLLENREVIKEASAARGSESTRRLRPAGAGIPADSNEPCGTAALADPHGEHGTRKHPGLTAVSGSVVYT
jgi:hypothetical protein